MKHTIQSLRLLGLGSLLAFATTTSTLQAGLPQPAPHRANSTAAVAASEPGDTGAMACSACKTTAITERKQLLGSKAGTVMYTTGSRHECAMCVGDIATANGKTVDSMRRDCGVCARSASFCCATPAASPKS